MVIRTNRTGTPLGYSNQQDWDSFSWLFEPTGLGGWDSFSWLFEPTRLGGWDSFSWLFEPTGLGGWDSFSWLFEPTGLVGWDSSWLFEPTGLGGWDSFSWLFEPIGPPVNLLVHRNYRNNQFLHHYLGSEDLLWHPSPQTLYCFPHSSHSCVSHHCISPYHEGH